MGWPWLVRTTHDTTQTPGESSRWRTGNLRLVGKVWPNTTRVRVTEQTEVQDTSTHVCDTDTPTHA